MLSIFQDLNNDITQIMFLAIKIHYVRTCIAWFLRVQNLNMRLVLNLNPEGSGRQGRDIRDKWRNMTHSESFNHPDIRGTFQNEWHLFFFCILVTLTLQNFAHVLWIVSLVCRKSFEWIQRVLYMFSLHNDELDRNSVLRLWGSIIRSLTIENNSRAEINCSL